MIFSGRIIALFEHIHRTLRNCNIFISLYYRSKCNIFNRNNRGRRGLQLQSMDSGEIELYPNLRFSERIKGWIYLDFYPFFFLSYFLSFLLPPFCYFFLSSLWDVGSHFIPCDCSLSLIRRATTYANQPNFTHFFLLWLFGSLPWQHNISNSGLMIGLSRDLTRIWLGQIMSNVTRKWSVSNHACIWSRPCGFFPNVLIWLFHRCI